MTARRPRPGGGCCWPRSTRPSRARSRAAPPRSWSNDSHSTMRNLPPDELAGGASYISGSNKPLYMMQGLDDSFDAVLFVSYHGSVGAPAGMSHTYNPRAVVEARLDGDGDRRGRDQRAGRRALRGARGAGHRGPRGLRGDGRAHPRRARRRREGARQPDGRAQPASGPGPRADPGDRAQGGRRGGRGRAAAAGSGRAGAVRAHHGHRRGGELGPGRGADRPAPAAHPRARTCSAPTARSARRSCSPAPPRRPCDRAGRVAVVTGAAGGIGSADLRAAGRGRVRRGLPGRARPGAQRRGSARACPAPAATPPTCATRPRCGPPRRPSGPTSARRGCWSTRPGCSASSTLTDLDEAGVGPDHRHQPEGAVPDLPGVPARDDRGA